MSLIIKPIDPIVCRDSRPFGVDQGNRMYCMNWPSPSMLAGSLRTLIGKCFIGESIADTFDIDALKRIMITGPFACVGNELFFQTPFDLVAVGASKDAEEIAAFDSIRPETLRENEGINCVLGDIRIQPSIRQHLKKDTFPVKNAQFLSNREMDTWLQDLYPSKAIKKQDIRIAKEERTHVAIDNERASAEESMLFSSEALDFSKDISLSLKAETQDADYADMIKKINCTHSLGGERRLARWQYSTKIDGWQPSADLKTRLKTSCCLRMILATPAIFSNGWYPGWLTEKDTDGYACGVIPHTEIKVRLISALIGRWMPIAGWNYEKQNNKSGPKALRRMVPAGGVYFLEIINNKKLIDSDIESIWLKALETGQDATDGFGSALWGCYTK